MKKDLSLEIITLNSKKKKIKLHKKMKIRKNGKKK